MIAQQPETPVTASEERIGKYLVHPVAAMFPLLEGDDYENLHGSIETYGLHKPIILLGDMLLDGRNRLKICLELGIEPRLEQYVGPLDPVDYILIANVDRRHLGPDERSAICFKIRAWRIQQRNAAKKVAAGAAQGHHGAEGGRGKKKPLSTESCEGVTEPKTRASHARSTVGQIAEQAKVSHHKAAQAVAVGKAAPDLLDQVAKSEIKLKDAHAKVKAAKSPQPPAKKLGYLDVKSRLIHRIRRVMQTYPLQQADLRKAIIGVLEVSGLNSRRA